MSEVKFYIPRGTFFVRNGDSGETITLNKSDYDKLKKQLEKCKEQRNSYCADAYNSKDYADFIKRDDEELAGVE